MKSIPRRWTSSKGASMTRRSTPWSIPRRRRPTGQTPGSGKRSTPRWARPWTWNTTAPPARAPSRTRRRKCNSGNSTSANGRTPPCAGCRWTSGTPAPSRSIPRPCVGAPATAGWICPVPPTSPPLCWSFRPTRMMKTAGTKSCRFSGCRRKRSICACGATMCPMTYGRGRASFTRRRATSSTMAISRNLSKNWARSTTSARSPSTAGARCR